MIEVDQNLTAKIEPFDSFWEAPKNIETGYLSFAKFYQRNYLKFISLDKDAEILVVSCGFGYLVNLLTNKGYKNVLGIDSDSEKVQLAQKKQLNCRHTNAFPFLEQCVNKYDLIFCEQEINHLTKNEIILFLSHCFQALKPNGSIIVHSLNGANPITGAEALAQNYDHFNTLTEYSLTQILEYTGYHKIKVFPLNLYIFFENPLNYIGLVVDFTLKTLFRISFIFYGKHNKIFSKKFGAIAFKKM